MKIRAPQIEIPVEEPFRNDLLGRKESSGLLLELIRSTDDPLVLCINASWGEGKSTFIKMWRQALINAGFKTLYFNAWENDFANDALVSIIGELELGMQELALENSKAKKARAHLNKAKKFGATLLRHGVPSVVKLATAGAVDLDKMTEEVLSQFGEKLAEEQVKRYEDSKKSVSGFRKELSEFAAELSTRNEVDNQRFPLVILIDELDRCRPIYAIEVLEKVKHFFSVSNVVFVLAMDKVQLGHSIRSQYGAGMDVDGYLRRFIDIDYQLPLPEKGVFSRAQFSRFGLHDFFEKRTARDSQYEYRQLEELFAELFAAVGCTLREQEHSFALLSLAIRTTPENYKIYPLLLGMLIILKIKNPNLYRDFIIGRLNHDDVLSYISSTPQGKKMLEGNYGTALEAYLLTCRSRHFEARDQILRYEKIATSSTENEAAQARAKRMISLLQSFDARDSYGILNYLVGKIDMVSRFDER